MRSRVQLERKSRAASPSPLYDQDFALWIHEQVAALRAGDVATLDIENLIEELEGLTKRDQRALGSQLKRIMAHLLEQRYQPQRASRSWQDSIRNGRERIEDILDQSPSLRRLLPDLMTKNYPRAEAFDPEYLRDRMRATESVIEKLQEHTTRPLFACKLRAKPELKVVAGGRGSR